MDKKELAEFEEIKWKSILSSKVDEFILLIADEDVFNKYFGLDYVEKISQKAKDLMSTNIKLGIIYSLMMLSLFAVQYGNNLDFQILGYSFKNLEEIKEYILLVSALLSLVASVFTTYHSYLQKIIEECLKKLSPDASVRDFYKHVFIHEPLDVFLGQPSGEKAYWHEVVGYFVGFFIVTLLLFIFSVIAGFYFIQFNVIYDVFENSSIARESFSIFIVSLSCLSILISVLIYVVQIPMPIVDYAIYEKLRDLEMTEPERYKAIMTQRIRLENTRETKLVIVIACSVFLFTLSIHAIFINPQIFENSISALFLTVFGSIFVMFFSLELNKPLQKHLYKHYFEIKPQDKHEVLKIFKSLQRRIWFYRIIFPFVFSAMYLTM